MKRTELFKIIPPCEAPKQNSTEVLAVSQIAEVSGKRILNIDLFYMGQRRGRYFADKEKQTHAANVDGKWYSCMMNNVARVCKGLDTVKGDYCYYVDDWKFSTEEDKQIALEYLEVRCFEYFESRVNQVKYERAYQRKRQKIDAEMDKIPCVPDEMEKWIQQEIFPDNYLFFSRKNKNRTEFSCTVCGDGSWRKKGWKHGEVTICPKCGNRVKAYSRKQEKTAKVPVVLLQVCGDEWVERQFRAECIWKKGERKEIKLFEEMRIVIPKGKCWGTVYYGMLTDADEFEQEFWDRNKANKHALRSFLYPRNLDEVLPYGNLQNSGLNLLCKTKINVNKFIIIYHKWPWLEYLAKAGMTNLAADIMEEGLWKEPKLINTCAKSLKDALRLDGNRTNRMKQINGGLNILEWLQHEQLNGWKISQDTLEYLQKKKVRLEDCQEILQELGSVTRMINYIKKQQVSPRKLTQTWRDYLRMARDEGMDTSDDIIRFPKDLKFRHDQLVERINARRDEERLKAERKKHANLDKQIRKHLPEVRRYFWEDDNYMIIPAGKCEELIEEGRALHHCVGSSGVYMNRMAEGKSWILFLRKKAELEKPYYTIEISMEDDRILQYYSEFDRQPDKNTISKILERFKRNIAKGGQRARIEIAAIA